MEKIVEVYKDGKKIKDEKREVALETMELENNIRVIKDFLRLGPDKITAEDLKNVVIAIARFVV